MIGAASRVPALLAVLVCAAGCGGEPPGAWLEVQRLTGSRTEMVQARCRTRGLREPVTYAWKLGASLRAFGNMPRDGVALLIEVTSQTAPTIECTASQAGVTVSAWTSLAPIVVRAVSSPSAGVVVVEGTGFGVAHDSDDALHLARARGPTLRANHACPGAAWSDTRIVACLPERVPKGAWQVRVQSGGRLGLLDTPAGALDIK